jgi:AraC-like DNA-binding protein
MHIDNYLITQKPKDQFLSTLVDYYFYIDIPVHLLSTDQEYALPFPRISFGYFFDHPFLFTNHTLNESVSATMTISRISTHMKSMQPQSDRIKIIASHIRPYALAYFTEQPIHTMPWVINTKDLFGKVATDFQHQIDNCGSPDEMFQVVEKTFLDNMLNRDLSLIINAIEFIEKSAGNIQITDLTARLGITDRTLRTHFYDHVGCSTKDYIRLTKLKQVAWQMINSKDSLTDIAHQNNYFDQSHFIHEIKSITGRTPNKLKKEIPNFRFLQF